MERCTRSVRCSTHRSGRAVGGHGEAGRRYPDVLANTTSGFGLGDFEWILAFEGDGLDWIEELIRDRRNTEAAELCVPFL